MFFTKKGKINNKKDAWNNLLADVNLYLNEPEKPKEMPSEEVRYSISIDSFMLERNNLEEYMDFRFTTFQEELMEKIAKRNMRPADFYKKAWMDRKLFSAIKNNVCYQPSRETAIACCLALELEYNEADRLLGKAGYSLSLSRKWDKIIIYCINHKIYDLFDVNELLIYFGEKQIF